MAKIRLGSRPKNFKKEIKIKMLDGSIGSVEVTYKYMTRSEYAAFLDCRLEAAHAADKAAQEAAKATQEAAKEEGREVPAPLYSVKGDFEKNDEAKVSYVLDVVEGWNLDVPFDKEAVQQLADELPAALQAIIDTYATAINEGRLGN